MQEQTNEHLLAQRKQFTLLKKESGDHIVQWAAPDKATSDQALLIKNILNRYELVSIAIEQSTISEKIYKEWLKTGFVEDWAALKPYVVQLRSARKHDKLWCSFERLADKWAKKL